MLLGGFAGFILGTLSRPSELIGQLPIGMVLTRGETLTGLDLARKSSAEASFNHVLVLAIIGAVVGGGIGWSLQQNAGLPTRAPSPEPAAQGKSVLTAHPVIETATGRQAATTRT